MRLSEIIKSNNTVIHCVTENEARELCREFHRLELKWVDGDSYQIHTSYGEHFENTCYDPKRGRYGDINVYKKQQYTIVPFSEVEFDGANKTETKTIDWEKRRYEISKDVLTSLVSRDGFKSEYDNNIDTAIKYADKLIHCISGEVDEKTTINRYPEIEKKLRLPEDKVVIDYKWGCIIVNHEVCEDNKYIIVQKYSYERLQHKCNGGI
ncbi:MAG: hypothetical protein ACRDD8_13195 [Bacteroidales bacterium]